MLSQQSNMLSVFIIVLLHFFEILYTNAYFVVIPRKFILHAFDLLLKLFNRHCDSSYLILILFCVLSNLQFKLLHLKIRIRSLNNFRRFNLWNRSLKFNMKLFLKLRNHILKDLLILFHHLLKHLFILFLCLCNFRF